MNSDEAENGILRGEAARQHVEKINRIVAEERRLDLIAAKEEAVARGKEAWDFDKFESFYDYYRTSKDGLEHDYYVGFSGKPCMTVEEFAEKLKNLEDWDR